MSKFDQPCQAFFVQVKNKWIKWSDGYIEAQVKFETLDQQWIRYISAYNQIIFQRYLIGLFVWIQFWYVLFIIFWSYLKKKLRDL